MQGPHQIYKGNIWTAYLKCEKKLCIYMGPFNMGRERYARDKSIASFIYFIFGYYMQKNKGIDGYFTFENV